MKLQRSAYLEIGFGVLLVAASLWIVQTSLAMGYMNRNMPGAGFFPFWIGCLLALSAALLIWSAFAEREPDGDLPIAGPVLAMMGAGGFIIGCWLIGVVLASFFYLFLVFLLHARIGLRASLIGAVVSGVLLYGIFVVWLEVPLPTGLLDLV